MVKTVLLEESTEESLNNEVEKHLASGYNKINTTIKDRNVYQQLMYKEWHETRY